MRPVTRPKPSFLCGLLSLDSTGRADESFLFVSSNRESNNRRGNLEFVVGFPPGDDGWLVGLIPSSLLLLFVGKGLATSFRTSGRLATEMYDVRTCFPCRTRTCKQPYMVHLLLPPYHSPQLKLFFG
ncbi:hypothetical protein K440DRAFT_237240 [Wilcoxina mikolae CBS 423.85]|nr:hypothetical protein K440DRAFT_237240 [Wilcoxina mikolae CBS 423.85]